MKSKVYQDAFVERSGVQELNGENIASYLYFLDKPVTAVPEDLYTHLFYTLNKIRSLPLLGEVWQPVFSNNILFQVISIGSICLWLYGLWEMTKSGTRFRFLRLLLQESVLWLAAFFSGGAALCALTLWACEYGMQSVIRIRTICSYARCHKT